MESVKQKVRHFLFKRRQRDIAQLCHEVKFLRRRRVIFSSEFTSRRKNLWSSPKVRQAQLLRYRFSLFMRLTWMLCPNSSRCTPFPVWRKLRGGLKKEMRYLGLGLWLFAALPDPENIPVPIIQSVSVKGATMSYELREDDLKVSAMYPDIDHASTDQLLDMFLAGNAPPPARAAFAWSFRNQFGSSFALTWICRMNTKDCTFYFQ